MMETTSQPQRLGNIIDDAIRNSNAPLWAGLRAYRAKKGGHNGQTL